MEMTDDEVIPFCIMVPGFKFGATKHQSGHYPN